MSICYICTMEVKYTAGVLQTTFNKYRFCLSCAQMWFCIFEFICFEILLLCILISSHRLIAGYLPWLSFYSVKCGAQTSEVFLIYLM